VQADGWSLDDKRTPLLAEDKLGPVPVTALSADEHAKNNLPDVLARWTARVGAERERPRTAQSFCVPGTEIAAQGYDLSLSRYKEVPLSTIEHRPAVQVLAEILDLEADIHKALWELADLLK
jgi:type I restriction enzyme M protein